MSHFRYSIIQKTEKKTHYKQYLLGTKLAASHEELSMLVTPKMKNARINYLMNISHK